MQNNGNGTFTSVTREKGLAREGTELCSGQMLGSDINNDRAVDLVKTCPGDTPAVLLNPREGKFEALPWNPETAKFPNGIAVLDFDHGT